MGGWLIGLAMLAGGMAAEQTSIPLRTADDKQFTLEAVVAGRQRTFLFDTGEGQTMIAPALARDLGCAPWGHVTAFRMTGERLDAPRCDAVAFTMAGRRFTAATTIVYDLGEITGPDGPRFDGAVGLDLFDGRTITLQFGRRRVIVEDAAGAARRRRGRAVPIRLSRSESGALDANIGVPTPRGTAWMELDSANAGPTVFVSQALAPLYHLRPDTTDRQPVSVPIIPGVAVAGQARVLPGMIFDGNIGMQLMRDWDLTLDLATGRGWLSPAERAPGNQPPPRRLQATTRP